jgi:hypothetical protein
MDQITPNLFERATRIKLRFPTVQGYIDVEDVWDLPLTSTTGRANLDDLAKTINREIKEAAEESFVVEASKVSTELQLAFDVVMHIIQVRIAERDAEKIKAENKLKKQKILDVLARKQDEQLSAASVEDLTSMLNAL